MVNQPQHWLRQARRATFEDYRRQRVSMWVAPTGTSMRPLIGRHTWMLVEFGAQQVQVGDIVLFPLGEILVAHRVIARRERLNQTDLTVKGDAEPYTDPSLDLADVLGVVRAIRTGKHGTATQAGCAGWTAQPFTILSRLSGRSARFARRAAAFLPGPPRRLAQRAIPPFARVTASILMTPLVWAVLFQSKSIQHLEGGEQHEAL